VNTGQQRSRPPSELDSIATPSSERRGTQRSEVIVALHSVLDEFPHSVFVVSSESRLLFQNRGARALIQKTGTLQLRRGFLWIGDSLAGSLVRSQRSGGESSAGSALWVSQGTPARRHCLYVTRLGLRRRTDPIAIVLFPSHRGRQVSVRMLKELYRLTQAEATTAAQLFAGLRPTEAARHLKVSTNTVRSHIKRIFAKCEVRSQVEFVRLVAFGPGVS
jgi:DNA-binding CsgD family transcriptional regulator